MSLNANRMKRKRNHSDSALEGTDSQSRDLILTDAMGRSIKVHKGLLINKSDYFATLLKQNNINAVHLDEKYLLELIHYLYRCECETSNRLDYRLIEGELNVEQMNRDTSIMHGDLEILMNLLIIAEKYKFKQLYKYLVAELNCRISPTSVLRIYSLSNELGLDQFRDQTRIMILSWLPELLHTDLYLQLPESCITDIFTCEPPDIDNECKLNALSAWWSKNKDSDMTNLWMKLITCNHN